MKKLSVFAKSGMTKVSRLPDRVNGATYVPREEPGYDAVGIASEVGSGSNETRSPHIYGGVGVVLKIDIEKSRVTVDHEEIEGYMKPMVMSYMVTSEARLEGLKPGDKVRFTIDADQRAIVNIVPLRE